MRELHAQDPLSLRVSEFDALLAVAISGEFAATATGVATDPRAYVDAYVRARQ